MASTSASASAPALRGQKIDQCFLRIDVDDEQDSLDDTSNPLAPAPTDDSSALTIPVTLRIFFDHAKCLAFFRLYTNRLELTANNTQVFLDIHPDKVRTLSVHHCSYQNLDVHGGPCAADMPPIRQYLRFRFTTPGTINLIVPQAIPPGQLLHLATSKSQTTLASLRKLLVQRSTLNILLPSTIDDWDVRLRACCDALSRQHLFATPLRPDRRMCDLRSLYQGQGGRVVDVDAELSEGLLFPASALSPEPAPAVPGDDQPPPAYPGEGEAHILETKTTTIGGRKRLRSRSPSRSPTPPHPRSTNVSSPPPSHNSKCAHLNLACTERECRIAVLLQCLEKKEAVLHEQIAQADDASRRLTALIAASKEREAALEDHSGGIGLEVGASAAAAVHANTPSADSRQGSSTASIASNISDRIQAYLTARLDRFEEEFRERADQVTSVDVENIVSDNLYGYVTEDAMYEAIQQAVDGVLEQVGEKLCSAFL